MDRGGGSDGGGSCSYYSVLGIGRDATFSDVRSAYRQLAMKWHPDRWAKNPKVAGEANVKFQKIQEAYSVLSDEGKRSMYDAGVLDLFNDDEGMGDFMYDLMKMMDNNNNKVSGHESLEDLQRSFMETFGADLASYYESEDPTAKKRTREGSTNVKASKRNAGTRC